MMSEPHDLGCLRYRYRNRVHHQENMCVFCKLYSHVVNRFVGKVKVLAQQSAETFDSLSIINWCRPKCLWMQWDGFFFWSYFKQEKNGVWSQMILCYSHECSFRTWIRCELLSLASNFAQWPSRYCS